MIEEYAVFPFEKCDVDTVYEIERNSFNTPWEKRNFETVLNNPNTQYLTVKLVDRITGEKGPAVGFIALLFSEYEGEIINLAVSPDYRRLGLGRKLILASLRFFADKKISNIFLEVRRSNTPAKNLYLSVGFDEIGIRKNYYSKPVEDALVMKQELF